MYDTEQNNLHKNQSYTFYIEYVLWIYVTLLQTFFSFNFILVLSNDLDHDIMLQQDS